MKYDAILNGDKYYTVADLRYNKEAGWSLNRKEVEELLDAKDNMAAEGKYNFIKLGLEPFNSKHFFFNEHVELVELCNEYCSLINSENVFGNDRDEMRSSRIYSEVEGSINIEGYNSTRAVFDELMNGRKPENNDEILIRNMGRAIDYVEQAPEFNADNFFELYSIISEGCLTEEQQLKKGEMYRYDMVFISSYNGAEVSDIRRCMDSLFAWVNESLRTGDSILRFLLPHIVHYYIVYVHPYFDCNGRMARMCSLWVSQLTGIHDAPYFISEAVNNAKTDYYKAINRSRDSRNDLTYFLIFIMQTSLRYAYCYYSLNMISDRLSEEGEYLTQTEYVYLKKIMLCSRGKYFGWKDFLDYTASNMTKQAALKYLNRWTEQGLLKTKLNSRKEKIFKAIDLQ